MTVNSETLKTLEKLFHARHKIMILNRLPTLMTQLVKHASPQQLRLRETPKESVYFSSGFALYDKDSIGWRTFYQV
jgi:hypothetical protein